MSPEQAAGRTLWLSPEPVKAGLGDVVAVFDPAWSPAPDAAGGLVVPVRDAVGTVLAAIDPIAVTSDLLDDWADASGVVRAMTIGQTSFWFGVRLQHWLWLQERVLWAHVVRELVARYEPATLGLLAGLDTPLAEVARLIAAADGLALADQAPDGGTPTGTTAGSGTTTAAPGSAGTAAPGSAAGVAATAAARPPSATAPKASKGAKPLHLRLVQKVGRVLGRQPSPSPTSVAWLKARYAPLVAEPERRLLAVHTHVSQVVGAGADARLVNAYLSPVEDRLAGTRLDPVIIERPIRRSDPAAMDRIASPAFARVLPFDVLTLDPVEEDEAMRAATAAAVATLRAVRVPVEVVGIDLGPSLAGEVADVAQRRLPQWHVVVARATRVIRALRPAAILVADEYHRQDWREAAARTGIPIVAIQHGTINRHHRGYIHRSRPPQLNLVERTYLFGDWEHDRLVGDSVYREDEVLVAGSPRLELVAQLDPAARAAQRAAVRAELGVRDGDRLVVLSGTWGGIYRRFHYPVVLARLFDRPTPGVHLVVKLHPSEQDEGPYRAVVEAAAAAGGFAPPPITVVKDVDLYRLLAAADAHLGVHSTVLTEAVFTGTPNLLATGIRGGDLLDYVASGVALPVRDGADLLAALDAAGEGAITDEARTAFIAHHYEPGPAAERIARDLLEWLPAT